MTTQVFRNINYTPNIATGNSQRLQGMSAPDWIAALGGRNVISTGQGADVILAGVQFVSIVPRDGDRESIVTNSLPNAGRSRNDSGIDFVRSGRDTVITDRGRAIGVLKGVQRPA